MSFFVLIAQERESTMSKMSNIGLQIYFYVDLVGWSFDLLEFDGYIIEVIQDFNFRLQLICRNISYYSSNKIRKTQKEHLNIIFQKVNSR